MSKRKPKTGVLLANWDEGRFLENVERPGILSQHKSDELTYHIKELLESFCQFADTLESLTQAARSANKDSSELFLTTGNLDVEFQHLRYHITHAKALVGKLCSGARDLAPLSDMSDDELMEWCTKQAFAVWEEMRAAWPKPGEQAPENRHVPEKTKVHPGKSKHRKKRQT